jgi:G3E family GTPase|mmetsp:Transcript_7256/g.11841  ORF Transcript_7256/g.11841 Transcript_7256/m.11841 type:complete len:523 (-) Transcript_7256:142-1710(-)
MQALPPWWILKGVTPAGPDKDMGGWTAIQFSEEQQGKYACSVDGKILDQAKHDAAFEGYSAVQPPVAEVSLWVGDLKKAEVALKESKFFDGVQFINACVEAFAKSLGKSGEDANKDPLNFVDAVLPDLSDENKNALKKIYEVRGDIIAGLGAHKRAATDYACALKAGSSPEIEAKKAQCDGLAKGPAKKDGKVPVTVLTGFLGSGKTTLLNRILKENHGKRIAVIENEFGEVGIDDALIESAPMRSEENLVEMNNGCICCTVRGDLIAGLKKLVKNAQKKDKPLDCVVIETTGLADPAPVAQTFFADDFVQQKLVLDGILTLVDAKHIIQHLEEEKPEGVENEAVEQIAFADRIILNKTDLVNEEELVEVEKRIRAINESVQIRRAMNSEVSMDYIMGIRAFDLDRILEAEDSFLDEHQEHEHDNRVTSVGINVKGEVEQNKLNEWIGWLLREKGADIFRTKGVLAVQGMKEKFVFQAVHMAFSGAPQKAWEEGEEKMCRMIFIGKGLNREELEGGFKACLV